MMNWMLAAVIALGIINVSDDVKSYSVNGPSMQPTMMAGDHMAVDKHYYKENDFRRGDIIIFQKDDVQFVKRVIGLPREKVKLEGDQVYINGKAIKETYLEKGDLPNMLNFPLRGESNVVPEGMIFVLGDHRMNSTDSRFLGYISMNKVIGKVIALNGIPLD
ncbi:signal peptidase I [Paenibacillus sp. 23TSA30-6]|nr:signal peptidase I [Paenibacillus sp. 23TSA30-6]